jgi:predicted Zn-dependent protease
MRWYLSTVLAGVLLIGTTSGCSRILQAAASAAPAFFPISDQQEEAIGQAAAAQALQANPALNNPSVQAYVQRIGAAVGAVSDRSNIPYRYTVVNSNDVNAFSLPGGYVFITVKLLKIMQNEAQLAGVLGHETGHIVAKHAIEEIRRTAVAQGIAYAAIGNGAGYDQLIASALYTLVQRGYGRQQELQADRLGALYGSRANYDPYALPQFLIRLEQATGGAQPAWLYPLETHPPATERSQALDTYISSNHLGTSTRLNQTQFQQAMSTLH